MAFEIFFRRAANNFSRKIGEDKIKNVFENMKDPLKAIPEEFKSDMASEIPKYLFKFSQGIENLKTEKIEGALNHLVLFTRSLSDLRDKRRVEVNDDILKRSNNGLRGLSDLMERFVNKAIEGHLLEESVSFEDILTFTLGEKAELPEAMGTVRPIHIQMTPYIEDEEFSMAKEHHTRVTALSSIMGSYLSNLKSQEGEEIYNSLKDDSLTEEHVVEDHIVRKEIVELPRDRENIFLNKAIELLKKQVLVDKELDKKLTQTVALKIMEKVFTAMVNGKNAIVRATKLRKLLKGRAEKNLEEERRRIDADIKRIIDEDLLSIKEQSLTFKDIISVLNRKRIYLDIFKYVKERFPEVIEDFVGMDPLQYIGSEYVDVEAYSDLVKWSDNFSEKMKPCMIIAQTFAKEANAAPTDAKANVDRLMNFFRVLREFNDNIGTDGLYGRKILLSGNSTLLAFLKYAYEFVDDVLWMVEKVHEMNIMPMPRFLSKIEEEENEAQIRNIERKIDDAKNEGIPEDAPMMRKLKKSLKRRKSAADKFKVMTNFLEESIKALERLKPIREFGMTLAELLSQAAAVHRNLPGALIKHLDMPENFKVDIDYFIDAMKGAMISAVMSEDDFEKIRKNGEKLKHFLLKQCKSKKFMENMRGMSIIYSFKDSNT